MGSSETHRGGNPWPLPTTKGAGIKNPLSMPSQWVQTYDDFITKNAHQVSRIESTLRSLTYIIPGTHAQIHDPHQVTKTLRADH